MVPEPAFASRSKHLSGRIEAALQLSAASEEGRADA
jgi:hypothetical protein